MKENNWVWQQSNFPEFTFDTSKVKGLIRRYDEVCGMLYGTHETLTKESQHEANIDVMVAEAISTAEIEGENLNRNSVRNSLRRQLGLSHDRNEKDQKSEGVASILLASRSDPDKNLDEDTLFDWHRNILGDGKSLIHPDLKVGQWRDEPMQIVSGPIGFEDVDYEAPPPEKVPELMNDFLEWFNDEGAQDQSSVLNSDYCVGPVRSAVAHLWFEVVHPLDDGNGRVGRAIADLALVKDNDKPALFSLSHVLSQHRNDYYEELGKASKQLDITDWVVWFSQRSIDAQLEARKVVMAVLEKTRFWDEVEKLPEDSLNPRQEKVLKSLFLHEPSGFEGGMTAKKYMNLTKTSKATATRDLADLAEKNCLVMTGGGRSTKYQLNLSKYQPDEVSITSPTPSP